MDNPEHIDELSRVTKRARPIADVLWKSVGLFLELLRCAGASKNDAAAQRKVALMHHTIEYFIVLCYVIYHIWLLFLPPSMRPPLTLWPSAGWCGIVDRLSAEFASLHSLLHLEGV